jgi:hypothetical protein
VKVSYENDGTNKEWTNGEKDADEGENNDEKMSDTKI